MTARPPGSTGGRAIEPGYRWPGLSTTATVIRVMTAFPARSPIRA